MKAAAEITLAVHLSSTHYLAMNEKVSQILKQAKTLRADEREALIDALLDNEEGERDGFATPEIAKAWEEEIIRRVAAYDRGEVETIDISEVTLESLRR